MAESWRLCYSWSDISDDPASAGDSTSSNHPQFPQSQPTYEAHSPHASTDSAQSPPCSPGQPVNRSSAHANLWRLDYSWGELSDSPTPVNIEESPKETSTRGGQLETPSAPTESGTPVPSPQVTGDLRGCTPTSNNQPEPDGSIGQADR